MRKNGSLNQGPRAHVPICGAVHTVSYGSKSGPPLSAQPLHHAPGTFWDQVRQSVLHCFAAHQIKNGHLYTTLGSLICRWTPLQWLVRYASSAISLWKNPPRWVSIMVKFRPLQTFLIVIIDLKYAEISLKQFDLNCFVCWVWRAQESGVRFVQKCGPHARSGHQGQPNRTKLNWGHTCSKTTRLTLKGGHAITFLQLPPWK